MEVNKNKPLVILSAFEGSIINFKGPLIEDLVQKDYKVHVLAPNISENTRSNLFKIGANPIEINLSRTSFNIFKDIKSLIELVIAMKRIKPEVFIGYYIKPVIWGGIAAFFANVPKRIVMIEGLGSIYTKSSQKISFKNFFINKLISILYKFSLNLSHYVLFLNEDDKKEFENKKIIEKNKGLVLGGIGLKLSEWPYIEPKFDPINFLFVGRIVSEKGIGEFIEAAKIIKKKYPKSTFTVLGEIEKESHDIVKVF